MTRRLTLTLHAGHKAAGNHSPKWQKSSLEGIFDLT